VQNNAIQSDGQGRSVCVFTNLYVYLSFTKARLPYPLVMADVTLFQSEINGRSETQSSQLLGEGCKICPRIGKTISVKAFFGVFFLKALELILLKVYKTSIGNQ
jgi:hypothetical protein